MFKRINHEIEKHIMPSSMVYNGQLYIQYKPERVVTVMVKLRNSDILFFTLDKTYPFSPPGVTISKIYDINDINNSINYLSYFTTMNKNIIAYLCDKLNVSCLCCNTILCQNKWKPTYNMNSIINEFIKKKRLVKDWYIKESLKLITNKFNIYDNYIINNIFQYYTT